MILLRFAFFSYYLFAIAGDGVNKDYSRGFLGNFMHFMYSFYYFTFIILANQFCATRFRLRGILLKMKFC